MENMASRESTPNFSEQSFRVSGIQAFELFRENGAGAKARTFFRNGTGDKLPANATNRPDTKITSTVSRAWATNTMPRETNASVPVVSMNCIMEKNTTTGINFTTTFIMSIKRTFKNSMSAFAAWACSPARLIKTPKRQAKNSI